MGAYLQVQDTVYLVFIDWEEVRGGIRVNSLNARNLMLAIKLYFMESMFSSFESVVFGFEQENRARLFQKRHDTGKYQQSNK